MRSVLRLALTCLVITLVTSCSLGPTPQPNEALTQLMSTAQQTPSAGQVEEEPTVSKTTPTGSSIGSLPTLYNIQNPTAVSDIGCRPKLAPRAFSFKPTKLTQQPFATNAIYVSPQGKSPALQPLTLSRLWIGPKSGESTYYLLGPVSTVSTDDWRLLSGHNGELVLGPVGFVVLRQLKDEKTNTETLTPLLDNRTIVVGLLGTLSPNAVNKSLTDGYMIVSNGKEAVYQTTGALSGKPILGRDGEPLPPVFAAIPPMSDPYCKPLPPLVRLLAENASVSTTFQNSNQVGLTNLNAISPASTALAQQTNTYSAGVGYVSKPFVKQFISAWQNDLDGREDVQRQGSMLEDFVVNAFTMSASVSYGRTFTAKNGVVTDAVTTRPSYSISVSYQMDLERFLVHAFHYNSWPVDAGYYYEPYDGSDFWPRAPRYQSDRPN